MSSRPQETARVCKQRRPSSPVLDEAVGGGEAVAVAVMMNVDVGVGMGLVVEVEMEMP